MPTISSTHKTKLNDKQLELLRTIYEFRFGSAELVGRYIGVTRRSMSNSLNVLLDRGFLHRRFDGVYHLLHKPASYCLTPKGIKALKQHYDLNEKVLHNIYHDRKVTPEFVDHSLNVFKTYLDLRDKHPGTFNIMTSSYQADFDDFPRPKPDLFLARLKPHENKPDEVFVDVYEEDVELWIIKKRIRLYLIHHDEFEWDADIYPTVLLLVEDEKKLRKLKRYANKQIEERWLEGEVKFVICSDIP